MKTMKIVAVFILLTILTVGRALAQGEVKEQLVVPLSEPGKPFKIKAHVMHGSVKIVGYEGKDIVIDVTGEQKRHESATSGGMKRIGGDAGGELTAEEDNNMVNINSGLSHFSLIAIKVPQTGATLDVGAINDGNITIDNVSGQLEVTNVNGGIIVSNVSGSVVASTVNGDVVVGFRTVNATAPMAFSTLNGKIDVTFPADLKANVKLKSERGDIYTDFDIEVTKDHPVATKTSEGHMYRINIDDWVMGKINGGGPEMMMKTMTGNVYIRKAK
ncbi:DUF4097 family beta strand repeat-containing protein [Puia dinghuensis]|uniref:DUF4097 domain-containing protein n=1 Tax=Puia dinghuensis TaxID=1792502 RepID=A0A8J2XU97_9BACT|nr:DUF4097 family beta strand repeat-containing protein [Puia dinghuensis]GGB10576.1 hypothetical protein GCM10011511_37700 [Puia dinghuensis]